jgi:hypothetical protein
VTIAFDATHTRFVVAVGMTTEEEITRARSVSALADHKTALSVHRAWSGLD